MLVLTRKYQEKIRIGDSITITVFRIKGNAVRLGIEAPAKVTVLRGELAYDHKSESAIEPEADSFGVTGTKQRAYPCAASTAKCWARNNGQERIEGITAYDAPPTVKMARVRRKQLVGLLPKLISGNEPLRGISF
jgi:carbon storage regulator